MGTTIADLVIGPPGATFTATIYKVPIRADGTFGATQPITVTGPAAATSGFGLNGIDSTNRRGAPPGTDFDVVQVRP